MAGLMGIWGRAAAQPRHGTAFAALPALIGAALDRRAQRRRLAELDPRLLRDIGITRAEALVEARKPMWRR